MLADAAEPKYSSHELSHTFSLLLVEEFQVLSYDLANPYPTLVLRALPAGLY